MNTKKIFALVALKKGKTEHEVVYKNYKRGKVVEHSLDLSEEWVDSFITRLHMDTVTYQDGWLNKFNKTKKTNGELNKVNGL